MSSKEVETLISSDEIDVSAEEDVFKFILAWIEHDKSKRKKYFAELFRHVRLVYVSRDFLSRDVVTNDLVKDNEVCLDLVKDAMNLIDFRSYHSSYSFFRPKLVVRPRKSLETAAIVFMNSAKNHILGYFPREDKLCILGELSSLESLECQPSYISELFTTLVSCHGKLFIAQPFLDELLCYDPFTSTWRWPSTDKRQLQQIFVSNKNEMYALMTDSGIDTLYIRKYKPESNSWEADVPFKCGGASLWLRKGMCKL